MQQDTYLHLSLYTVSNLTFNDTEVFLLLFSNNVSQTWSYKYNFFFFGSTAHIWALAYLHETFRFTSVY
jgi:hypothetical protein